MENIKLSTEDFGILAVYAIRYCQGRVSYIHDSVRSVLRPYLQALSDKDLTVMLRDCECQHHEGLFGDDRIDRPGWLEWERELQEEKERREAKAEAAQAAADKEKPKKRARKGGNAPHLSTTIIEAEE